MKKDLKIAFVLYFFIAVIWTLYRMFTHFSELTDEGIFKVIVWMVPTLLIIFLRKQKPSEFGITGKNILQSIGIGLGAGLLLSLPKIIIFLKGPQALSCMREHFIPSFVIAFFTAITEEIVFRGYLFTLMNQYLKNGYMTIFLNSILFTLIHLPILILSYRYSFGESIAYLSMVFMASLVYSTVFLKTKNVAGSIATHIIWNVMDDLVRC